MNPRQNGLPDPDAVAGVLLLLGVVVCLIAAFGAIWTVGGLAFLARIALTGGALVLIACGVGLAGEEFR